jgi:hypothetical protein
LDDDTLEPGEPPNYTVVFVDDVAYDEFADIDCPDLRALMDEVREDPFPNRSSRHRVPEQPGRFFAFHENDGIIYKMSYQIDLSERQIVVFATSAQRLPIY